MPASNLSTVTTELIESYGNTAKNMIHAYRTGSERVARFVGQRCESAIQRTASRLRADVGDLAGKLEQGSSRLANTVAGKKTTAKVAAVKRPTTSRKVKVAKDVKGSKATKKMATRVSPAAKNETTAVTKPAARKTAPRKSVAKVETSPTV